MSTNITQNRYLEEFSIWLQEEDKGEKTIRTYQSVLQQFVKWYEQTEVEEFDPANVKPLHLMDYRSFMTNTLEQKPATINKGIATLKTFFAWAVEAKYVNSNPATKVKMKRV